MDRDVIEKWLLEYVKQPELHKFFLIEADGLVAEGWKIWAKGTMLRFETPTIKWWGKGVVSTSRYELSYNPIRGQCVCAWNGIALDKKRHWPKDHPNLFPTPCLGAQEHVFDQPNPFIMARAISSMLAGKVLSDYGPENYGDEPYIAPRCPICKKYIYMNRRRGEYNGEPCHATCLEKLEKASATKRAEIEKSVREYYAKFQPRRPEQEITACINQWEDMEKAGWVITQEENKRLRFVTPPLTFYREGITATSRYALTYKVDNWKLFDGLFTEALDRKPHWPKDHPHVFHGRLCHHSPAVRKMTNPLDVAETMAAVLAGQVTRDNASYSMIGFADGVLRARCQWCHGVDMQTQLVNDSGNLYHAKCLVAMRESGG